MSSGSFRKLRRRAHIKALQRIVKSFDAAEETARNGSCLVPQSF